MGRFRLIGILLVAVCSSVTFSQTVQRLSLTEALALARQNNPEVRGAGHAIEAARGRMWRGISPPPPTLSYSYDYIPARRGISEYGERAIGISQSFDFPTTIGLRWSSLSSERDASTAEFSQAALVVRTRVKEAYYDVLAKQQKLRLAEENLALSEDFARKAEIRYNVGEGTNLEQLTAKVQRTQAQNNLEVARNDLALAEGGLSSALGYDKGSADRTFELTDSLSFRPYVSSLESVRAAALGSNPQILAAQCRLSASTANLSIAWSSFLPSFNISYSRQTQIGNPNLFGVSFGVSLPVWFFLDHRGQIQEASAAKSKLEEEFRSLNNAVMLDVKSAYLEFKNDERMVQVSQSDLLPQALEAYRAATTSYESGEITYVELLQAKQTLVSVRSSFIDALYHYNTSIARLERAIGQTIAD